MLKIVQNPEFTHTVKVSLPVDGGFAEHSFKARFRALSVPEIEAFDTNTVDGTTRYLNTILVGWEDVVDDAGQPLPVNDANRDMLIGSPSLRMALMSTYSAAMLGAKRGN